MTETLPVLRRRRDAATTRSAILTAARRRLLADSYESASLRGIAAEAKIDVALIMRYFGSKEGLFQAVIESGSSTDLLAVADIEDLPAALAAMVSETASDEQRVRMEIFVIMLRSASSPKAGPLIREQIRRHAIDPVAALLPEGDKFSGLALLAILSGAGMLHWILRADGGRAERVPSGSTEGYRRLFAAALQC